MQLPSLSQWWGKRPAPASQDRTREPARPTSDQTSDPFQALHRDMTRAFDDFWRTFETTPFGLPVLGMNPRADVTETDKAITLSFELPGLNEKDLEVSVSSGLLTVKAEKKSEPAQGLFSRHVTERSYGLIQRTMSLPPGVDADQAAARYHNGVLTVTVPKLAQPESGPTRIPVRKG